MTSNPADLLRQLGAASPAARVSGAAPRAGSPLVENAGFADLLKQAASGEISSGLPVSVDQSAKLTLSNSELTALAQAADRAEAAGVRRALVLSGNQALILDVHTRTITGRADMPGGVLSGVDGVIRLDNPGAPGTGQPTLSGAGNQSLLKALGAATPRR